MKPVQQLFALVLEDMPKFRRKKLSFQNKVETLRQYMEPEKFLKKEADMRNKEVKILLFDDYLRVTENMKKGNQEISKFFCNAE